MDEITIDLNEKLEELRKTKFYKKTYTIKEMPSKYRYREIFGPGDQLTVVPIVCTMCKKEIKYQIRKKCKEDLETYNEIINAFNKLGMDAKFVFNCKDCCSKNWDTEPFEVWLKVKSSSIYYKTYPIEFHSMQDEINDVCAQEYIIALKFLRACVGDLVDEDIASFSWFDKFKQNFRLSYSKLYQYESCSSCVNKYGFIKPIVDLALYKVLNLQVNYDRNELKDNIRFLLKEYRHKESKSYLFQRMLRFDLNNPITKQITKQKHERIIRIIEKIIDNKNLDQISVLEYFKFIRSLQIVFEYDDKYNDFDGYNISPRDLERTEKSPKLILKDIKIKDKTTKK